MRPETSPPAVVPRLDLGRPAVVQRPWEAPALARRRVVITGIGIVAPSGIGTEALWDTLVNGRSAVRPVEGFDVSDYPVKIAAQVPGFRPQDFMTAGQSRRRGRFCQLGTAAVRLAVDQSRLPPRFLMSDRAGLFIGTAAGGIGVGEEQHVKLLEGGVRTVKPTFPIAISPHFAAAEAASDFGIAGPIATLCSECPSGLDALVTGARAIANGGLDVAVVGGADAPITPLLFAGFARSGMLASGEDTISGLPRPFDEHRSGFALGEGAAVLVLEWAELAFARGAEIFGEILGSGIGKDRPLYLSGETDPSGHGFISASTHALEDSDISASEIDLVNAHAPGMTTPDAAEARALETLFGSYIDRVPVVSIKGAVGHPLAAAGVMQIIASILSMRSGIIPPTVNCDSPDGDFRLHIVRSRPETMAVQTALVTSHGFGGNTTSVILRAVSN